MTYGASLGSSRPLIDAVIDDMTTDQALEVRRDPSAREPYYTGAQLAAFLKSADGGCDKIAALIAGGKV